MSRPHIMGQWLRSKLWDKVQVLVRWLYVLYEMIFRWISQTIMFLLTLTSSSWFISQCLVFLVKSVSYLSTIWCAWNECEMYMSVWNMSSDTDFIFIFIDQSIGFFLVVWICFFDKKSKSSTTVFDVWNNCKVYVSVWQESSDLDLVMMMSR